MDYLWEVERRQSAALTRLLTGTRSSETAETEDSTEARARMKLGRETVSRPGEGTLEWAEAERTAAKGSTSHASQTGAASSMLSADAAQSGDTALEEQAETFYRTRQSDALWREGIAAAGSLPGLLMPISVGTAEVEDLSRAVQLDARRYDGGFRIY